MKNNKISICFLCIFLTTCVSQNTDKNFIPGTYVREVHNEFSIGRDTLIIGFNQTGYLVIHNGSSQRINEGKLLPVKSFHENWAVVYDDDKKVLQEIRRGRILSFYPSRNILFLDNSPYKKVK